MFAFRLIGLALATMLLVGNAVSDPVDFDVLDERLTRLASDPEIVGLAVAVIEDGEITFAEGYGVTKLGGDAVNDHTVFRWASLSKGVASTAVGKMVADGQLTFSDTISKFKTSLRLPLGGEKVGTLDDLLSHQIGIVPNAYDTRLEDGGDPAQIRKALGKLKRTCSVGECHTYQNVAFDAISEIVASVRGIDFEEVVRLELFQPLNMQDASYGLEALLNSYSWAEPHRKRRADPRPVKRIVNRSYYRVPAAGGVNGSIRDLAQFARAQMGLEPEILSPDTLTELHTPRVYTRREQSSMSRRYGGHLRDARYALGWRVYKYGKPGYRVVGHRGAVDGYRSMILFDPERNAGVVALWNSNSRKPVGIQFEVMDMIYGLEAKDWLQLDTPASD
ncbi:MAG: beta-lactamase family protein [Alphaproteobacteria bacterium]|nr:beta-lactamase family protein [Henriciella sp.]MBO6694451.1 beta-lactamase family protein [Henriciella sp.]MCH9752257.1 beta-lactamase family protein [Alphaproteobacteria bacterium]